VHPPTEASALALAQARYAFGQDVAHGYLYNCRQLRLQVAEFAAATVYDAATTALR
jgi:hypothetical protein